MNDLLFADGAAWYSVPALIGTTVFVFRMIMMMIGGGLDGADLGGDVDFDLDADVATAEEVGPRIDPADEDEDVPRGRLHQVSVLHSVPPLHRHQTPHTIDAAAVTRAAAASPPKSTKVPTNVSPSGPRTGGDVGTFVGGGFAPSSARPEPSQCGHARSR